MGICFILFLWEPKLFGQTKLQSKAKHTYLKTGSLTVVTSLLFTFFCNIVNRGTYYLKSQWHLIVFGLLCLSVVWLFLLDYSSHSLGYLYIFNLPKNYKQARRKNKGVIMYRVLSLFHNLIFYMCLDGEFLDQWLWLFLCTTKQL